MLAILEIFSLDILKIHTLPNYLTVRYWVYYYAFRFPIT